MSCPILQEVALIRGAGIYDEDDDSRAVFLGGAEIIIDAASAALSLVRLEHARFIAGKPTREQAIRWWGLRYAEYSGKPLSQVHVAHSSCPAYFEIIGSLARLSEEISRAIERHVAYNQCITITIPAIPSVYEYMEPHTNGICNIDSMVRLFEQCLDFARGVTVGSVKFDRNKLPKLPRRPNVKLRGSFPELDVANPVSSCVLAAASLEKVCQHNMILEEYTLEIARASGKLISEYARVLNRLLDQAKK